MTDSPNFPLAPDLWTDTEIEPPQCELCELLIIPNIFRTNKHHCRKCGHLVCESCSTGKLDGLRVCDECRLTFKLAHKGDFTQLTRLTTKIMPFPRRRMTEADIDEKHREDSESQPSDALPGPEEDSRAPPRLTAEEDTEDPVPETNEIVVTSAGGRGGLVLESAREGVSANADGNVSSGSTPPPPTESIQSPFVPGQITEERQASVTTFVFPEDGDPNLDNYGAFEVATPILSRGGHELADAVDQKEHSRVSVPSTLNEDSSEAESESAMPVISEPPSLEFMGDQSSNTDDMDNIDVEPRDDVEFATEEDDLTSPITVPDTPELHSRRPSARLLALERAQKNREGIQELLDSLQQQSDDPGILSEEFETDMQDVEDDESDEKQMDPDMNSSLLSHTPDLHVSVPEQERQRLVLFDTSSMDSIETPKHSKYYFFCEDDLDSDDLAEFEEYIQLMKKGQELSTIVETMVERGVSPEKIKKFENAQIKRLRRIRKSRPTSPVLSPKLEEPEEQAADALLALPPSNPSFGFERRKSQRLEQEDEDDDGKEMFSPELSEANLARLNREVVTHEDRLAAQFLPPLPDYTPSVDMQQVFWHPVPLERISKSLWVKLPQGTSELNEPEIEEYFQFQVSTRRRRLSAPSTQAVVKTRSNEQVVALTTNTRALQVQSGLSKLNMPDRDIRRAVYALDQSALKLETIKLLRSILPRNHELEAIRGYEGNKKRLGRVEQFFYMFKHTTDLDLRLQLFSFRLRFKSSLTKYKKRLSLIQACMSYMKDDSNLEKFLSRTLSVANYLNARTNRATYGFSLASVDAMSQAKSPTRDVSVLSYVCHTFASNDELDVIENLIALKDELKEAASHAYSERTVFLEWNRMKIDLDYNKKKAKMYRDNVTRLLQSFEPKTPTTIHKELIERNGVDKTAKTDFDIHKSPVSPLPQEEQRDSDAWSRTMDRFFNRAAKSIQSTRDRLSKLKKRRQKLSEHFGESQDCAWDDLFSMSYKFICQVEAARDVALSQDQSVEMFSG